MAPHYCLVSSVGLAFCVSPPPPHPAPATGVSASWACLSEAAERNLSGTGAPIRDSHNAHPSTEPCFQQASVHLAPCNTSSLAAAKQLGSEVEGTTKAEGSLGAFPSRRGLCPRGLAPWAGFRSGPEVVLTVFGSLLSCYQKGAQNGETLPLSAKKTHLGFSSSQL